MKHTAALEVFETLCQALDNRNWKYDKYEEMLAVACTIRGDDLPMKFIIAADEERQVLQLFSRMPFSIAREKWLEANVAVCAANYGISYGGFDFDVSSGVITYHHSLIYQGALIRPSAIDDLINSAYVFVDKYNDRFLALSKGMLSLEQFIKMD